MFAELVTLALTLNVVKSKIIPKIVKGDPADIGSHAHSAFIHIESRDGSYICGASILNQKILLTAAHCVEICVEGRCTESDAYTGHSNNRKGQKNKLAKFKIHERYDTRRVEIDIGLVLLKTPLKLGEFVKRISIRRMPTAAKFAVVAAWGIIDDDFSTSDDLHYAKLKVWSYEQCRKILPGLSSDFICAGQLDGKTYAAEGDSGSALVVNGYIEIGLVSFKRPEISRSVVAFTDVSHFYDWITINSKKLYCEEN